MKSIGNKSIVLGTIVLFIIASMPTTLSESIKSTPEKEPANNEIVLFVDFPDAHIYFTPSKIRYPEVEFEEPGAVIDVNLSGIPSDIVYIKLNLTVHIHTEKQFGSGCLTWVISIGEKGEYGYGTHFSQRPLDGYWNDTRPFPFFDGIPFPTNFSATIPVNIYLTGLPVWFHRLYHFNQFFDRLRAYGVISFPKIFGAEVIYQMDFHT